MNGIWTVRTGFPFQVSQTNTLNTFNSPARPDRIANGKLDDPTVNQWFNPDAFHVVTCASPALASLCHYGNSGNGILRGPGFNNLDFGLFKNFQFSERMRLQFRSEFFNVANHPNFSTPNMTLTANSTFYPTVSSTGALGQFPTQAGRVQGPGAITSTVAPMRVIQFGLKFFF